MPEVFVYPHGLASPFLLTSTPVRRLLDSHRHWTGRELIERSSSPEAELRRLYEAPMVVVSHDTATDPIFWFGNRRALELFEMSWSEFTTLPSRYSAEPMERLERERFLSQVLGRGHVANYTGIRISSSGRRFFIENALVWNLLDESGAVAGQAACFSDWKPIPS
jgi:hypothetical protein